MPKTKRTPRRTKKAEPKNIVVEKPQAPPEPVVYTISDNQVAENIALANKLAAKISEPKLFNDKNYFMRAWATIDGDKTALTVKFCSIPLIFHATKLAMYIHNFIEFIEKEAKVLTIKVNDPRFKDAIIKLADANDISWPTVFNPNEFTNTKPETGISARELPSAGNVDKEEAIWTETVEPIEENSSINNSINDSIEDSANTDD